MFTGQNFHFMSTERKNLKNPHSFPALWKTPNTTAKSWQEPEPGGMRSVSAQLCISVYTKCTFLEVLINIFQTKWMWSNLIQHLSGRCKNRTGPFSFLASSLSRWCVAHKLSGVNTVILLGRRPSSTLPFLFAELFTKCSKKCKTNLKIPDNLLQHVGSHPKAEGNWKMSNLH